MEAAAVAPASTHAATASALGSLTRTSKRPSRARFLAMPPPIRPTPMHAMVVIMLHSSPSAGTR